MYNTAKGKSQRAFFSCLMSSAASPRIWGGGGEAVTSVGCVCFGNYDAIPHTFVPFQEHSGPLTLGLLFLVVPFLPASNLFFRVGFVVAERLLYAPR